jgi:hypothetical protein
MEQVCAAGIVSACTIFTYPHPEQEYLPFAIAFPLTSDIPSMAIWSGAQMAHTELQTNLALRNLIQHALGKKECENAP